MTDDKDKPPPQLHLLPRQEASLWFPRQTLGGQALPVCFQPIMQIVILLVKSHSGDCGAFILRRPCKHP